MRDRLKFYTEFIQEDIYLVNDRPVGITPAKPDEKANPTASPPESQQQGTILILFNHENQDHLPEGEQDLLAKILLAVNHSLSEAAFFNIYRQESEAIRRRILDHKAPFVIAFGVKAATISLGDPGLYAPHVTGGQTLLFADALSLISSDQSRKRLLWNALKKMF